MTRNEGARDCALCQLEGVPEGGRLPGTDFVVAYVDDEVIGLIPTDRPGVVLAPREHTETLFEKPERAGAILARLRRLVEEVKSSYGMEAATIEPTTALPGASGHVSYLVVPVLSGDGDEKVLDVATRAERLAELLRSLSADGPKAQSPGGSHEAPPLSDRPSGVVGP